MQIYNLFYQRINEINIHGKYSCIYEEIDEEKDEEKNIKIFVFTENSYLYEIALNNINKMTNKINNMKKRKTDIKDINFILKIENWKFVVSCNKGTYLYSGNILNIEKQFLDNTSKISETGYKNGILIDKKFIKLINLNLIIKINI